ncbi:MAG TPA: valine--tRNA ligase, partial [Rhizomicrobium sp.]
ERQLAERQMSRTAMGREKFLEAVWAWKAESGGAIVEQLRRLGASADWSRERFTMDEGLSRAVTKVFVQLYNEGLIYKDKRLVNWDPRLQTAVSDLEVENIEVKGNLWHIRYPIEGGGAIIVATTRPETMLGDTAVAVHPDDARYHALVGKMVLLPLTGRRIPIIADEYSDPEKGSGAVKITPGHDFNDFEVGKRHNLALINLINKDGTLNNDVPEKYRGLTREAARKSVLADLEALELIEKIEPITHAVPHDEKTRTVVLEPFLTEQWYLNVTPLAEKAIAAVESGATKFVPENWAGVYFNWLRNIRPWCISRQLWWGHRIPVWYGPRVQGDPLFGKSPKDFVGLTETEAKDEAQKYYGAAVTITVTDENLWAHFGAEARSSGQLTTVQIYRDPDVLDTWFSSALWPFSTLGWPDKTPELAKFYPTSALVTGFDIIFFWVARMMMMGLHFMGDVPFKTVFIHTRVLDEQGAKMSKTKGNVVDPLVLIDEFGADALRITLALAAGQNRDMRIGPTRVEAGRNFGTKLWNTARFCEMNGCVTVPGFDPIEATQTVNKWIITETIFAIDQVTGAIEKLRFNEAASVIYHFVYDVFCDWYIEITKPIFQAGDEAAKTETRATTAWARDQILKLLHPFMPFITEELWARTAAAPREALLIQTEWPVSEFYDTTFFKARDEMQWVIDLIKGVRSVRAEMNVPAAARITLVLQGASTESAARLARNRDVILTLARLTSAETASAIPRGSAQFVLEEATVALPLGDVIDFAKERARLEKDLKKAQEEIARFDAKLSNEQFVSRAPEEVLTEQREKRAEAAALVARLAEAIARLQE